MRNVKFASGEIYPVDRCGAADGQLRIRILPPFDFLAVAGIVVHPENTCRIEHFIDGTEVDHVVYEGYTVLDAMAYDGQNLLIILKEVAAV